LEAGDLEAVLWSVLLRLMGQLSHRQKVGFAVVTIVVSGIVVSVLEAVFGLISRRRLFIFFRFLGNVGLL
jgi:hypothetical protein